ncbi:MAG: S16 family serine protease [archaeon]
MKLRLILILILLAIPISYARSGTIKLLAVSNPETNASGSIATLNLEIKEGSGRVFIDSFPLSKLDTQISTRFAKEVACNFLERDCSNYDFFYTIRADSALVGGPSAGAATTVLTISVLEGIPIDEYATMTGTINTGGIIGPVGSILPKIDAARAAGIKKVLIPKYTEVNSTNYTFYKEKFGIDIIEVSRLEDAVYEFTGKNYSTNVNFDISSSYVDTMKQISVDMCSRAEDMQSEATVTEENNTASSLIVKGKSAISSNQHYSAASYCFGAALSLRQILLLKTPGKLHDKILLTKENIQEFRDAVEKKKLLTVTDLETFMAVTDRLREADESLDEAETYLLANNTNATIARLAYGIERFNSAYSWSVFFGKPGSEYKIDKPALEESCMKKISEVEERVQYVDLYFPSTTKEARDLIKKAYVDHNTGSPELCLYKASIAKAKVDLIVNSIAIDEKYADAVIEDRQSTVRSLIAKQNERGIFPIMAYSYYEYADSLKENDKYSALLYLEYALELGSLDIYFEKRKVELPRIDITSQKTVFLIGIGLGFVIGSSLTLLLRKREDKKGKKKQKLSN